MRALIISLALVVGLGVLVVAAQQRRQAPAPIDPQPREFALTDHRGQPFRLADVRGRPAAVFFGFTFCPDICPTELGHLARTLRALGPDADRIAPIFISVDPGRDTPEKLAEFVRLFDPRIVGLTGSAEDIAAVARQFGATYRRSDAISKDPSWYLIDHSTSTYLLDARGRWCDTIDSRTPIAEAADRIRRLIP